MSKLLTSLAAWAVLTASAAGPAIALEAELTVQEPAGVARKAGVLTCGIPFAAGVVKDPAVLTVQSGGKPAPAQFATLAKWSDGSVRWALLDCQVDAEAGGRAKLSVRDGGANPAPASPVKVTEGADEVAVSTGPLSFAVSKNEAGLFRSLKVDGAEMLAAGGRGLVLTAEDGKQVAAGKPSEVRVEAAGPMRAVVCARGVFPDVHNGQLGYTVRATAYAGSKLVKVRVWLENNGAHGFKAKSEWFFFKGLAVELALDGAAAAEVACEGAKAAGKLRVSQTCPGGTYDKLAYRIVSGDKELAKGARTDGVLTVAGGKLKLTAAVRDFWQNYDQALEFDAGALRFWLWPTDGQWPRKGEMDKWWTWTRKDGLTALPGGVHKGHELALDFSGRPAAETAAELSAPLAAVNPEYFASTEAANILFAPAGAKSGDDELDWKLTFRDNMAANLLDAKSKTSLAYARTAGGRWYGWMDFGDVVSPSGGYYSGWLMNRSLHFDWTWSALLHYMRTGNPGLLGLGTEMARHLEEVDQDWSDRDSAPFRALFRGDSSQPETHTSWSDEYSMGQARACGNWLGGIVLYYMLTGDPKARECAERNYKGMQESCLAPLKAKPGAAVCGDDSLQAALLTIGNLMSLHALTGDEKYLADVKLLVDNWIVPATKNQGPHMFDPGRENAGQGYQAYGQQLAYGIAALCDYCYRTKDDRVVKLLKDIAEKGPPPTFYEGPLFFSDLYGYLGASCGDRKMLEKGMRCFADGFPESRIPAIYSADRADWTVRPPMNLRAGSILHFLCWKSQKGK
jgi:hypothetical protein